jgi:hypothetical protein
MRDTYTVRQTAQLRLFAYLAGEPWRQGKLVEPVGQSGRARTSPSLRLLVLRTWRPFYPKR